MPNYSQHDPNQHHNPHACAEPESEINLADFLMALRANWYWFALSIAVCVLCPIFYLKFTP